MTESSIPPADLLSTNTDDPAPDSRQTLDRMREILLGDNASQRPQRAEVDRLRDILFGPEIERYERRLNEQRSHVDRLTSELKTAYERLAESERAQTRRFESLEDDLRRTTATLQREIDRQSTQDSLVRQLVGQENQHQLASQALTGQIADLRRQLMHLEHELRTLKLNLPERFDGFERNHQTLRRDVRQWNDDLRAEMRRVLESLDDQKTDRKALASMLIEVAAGLETGNSMTGLLEGLSPSSSP